MKESKQKFTALKKSQQQEEHKRAEENKKKGIPATNGDLSVSDLLMTSIVVLVCDKVTLSDFNFASPLAVTAKKI